MPDALYDSNTTIRRRKFSIPVVYYKQNSSKTYKFVSHDDTNADAVKRFFERQKGITCVLTKGSIQVLLWFAFHFKTTGRTLTVINNEHLFINLTAVRER